MKGIINWKIFSILVALSLGSVIAVFPYIMTLQGDVLQKIGLPLPLFFVLQLIQSGIFFSVATFLGLYFTKKINFHLPLFEAYFDHREYKKNIKSICLLAVPAGFATALTIYLTDILFTVEGAALSTSQNLAPVWQKLLASLYGGITEEILMRLFLMSLLIWIGKKITRSSESSNLVIVISILLSSIVFGLGHLPITASLTAITPLIVMRAIVLNGIGGIVFGWLFWKKGLEAAMIAHMTTDIFLLTVLPMVLGQSS